MKDKLEVGDLIKFKPDSAAIRYNEGIVCNKIYTLDYVNNEYGNSVKIGIKGMFLERNTFMNPYKSPGSSIIVVNYTHEEMEI